ncbi:DUF1476 domain-containing protein [Marivibrio halodurans]|uniref:DUF1476 domain-containing protein n=1 Tax=Marivibrio halodurans TaxID=2039722 RepID=A0A8J7UZX4_9PROT|nr:DUF1476 domain-containing protein [Marivibrio halodurans]MBP5856141.1 DUF1476 domain-containing protein [Marivibrio halodurans]
MTTFNDREKSFEAKFSRDQEHDFRAIARRNKLLGLWAAEQLGLSGDEAAAYALEVVDADFQRPGDDDVVEKVVGDLTSKGVDASEHLVRKRMEELLAEAVNQIDGK